MTLPRVSDAYDNLEQYLYLLQKEHNLGSGDMLWLLLQFQAQYVTKFRAEEFLKKQKE